MKRCVVRHLAAVSIVVAGHALAACEAEVAEQLATVEGIEQALTGETCEPGNAAGVVAPVQKAMLDTIAWAEGTRGAGKDGYNVANGFVYFSRCDVHPGRALCSGCSTAAGRYQFLAGTWSGLQLPNFWPENQERGAMALIGRRGVSLPPNQPLSAAAFGAAIDKLSWEWASLPPQRYPPQRVKSLNDLWNLYSQLAGAGALGSDNCYATERNNAAQFGCMCADHRASGAYCDGTGCTAQETYNFAQFGCGCVDHKGSGAYCDGTGCTVRETINANAYGCQCVDHKPNGGWCDGSGCTVRETDNCSKYGCGCTDHKCSGGFCGGTSCTARETDNCSKYGCGCQDHECAGGACG